MAKGMKMPAKRGCIHVYTGEAKGKTTAALGLAFRALGRGWRVLIVKYLKPRKLVSGEDLAIARVSDQVDEIKVNAKGICGRYSKRAEERIKRECDESLHLVEQAWWRYDLVVLDEINIVLCNGYIDMDKFMFFLHRKPRGLELVLTGRNAPRGVIQMADYVTHMKMGKHPYEKGIKARKGVEY